MRVGIGYDIHRLVAGRPLRLGGVDVPSPLGLLGHSDGDVLLHAVADALLGAAALGDIGEHFPDADPAYQDADSAELLTAALEQVREAGYEPVNLDANVLAERPRLGRHKAMMRERVAALLGLPPERVSIKARSHEGLDAVGRGRAIAAQAVVLIEEREA
ncbi:MAG: 2-C-methyl-D-erythritol 2,4-cyclodiphosphate synthase [Planctomycetota bacterium]